MTMGFLWGPQARWLARPLRSLGALGSRLPARTNVLLLWALAAAHAALFYWVCDDAFISFRYSQQLLSGNGLVFNIGERVEGYTNLLWVLEVALLGVLRIPMPIAAVGLSLLATAGTFLLVERLAHTTPFPSMRRYAVMAALLLLAVNRNVAVWTTSGLETRQFTFLIVLAVWLVRRALRGRAAWWSVSLVLGAAELTRPEGALIAACVGAWVAWQLWRRRGPVLRPLLELGLPCAALVVGHYLWRHAYYGDWLPNTAYAKVVRAWPDAGILYFGAAALHSALYLGLPLAIVGGWFRWLRRRDALLSLCAFVILPHALYITLIGGDHFEFRVLDHYWPLLAVCAGDALAGFALWLRLRLRRGHAWQAQSATTMLWSGALALLVAYATVLQVAQLVVEYPRRSKRDLLPEPPLKVSVAAFPLGQLLPRFESLVNAYQGSMDILTSHAIGVSWVEHRDFQATLLGLYGRYGRRDRQLLPEGAVMAHNWMGIMPFHLREVTFIDKFGLTDRTIARSGEPSNEHRTMAHDRRPPPGYLEQRGVNIAIEPAARSLSRALDLAPYAIELADGLWAPFSSERPEWVETAFRGRALYHPDFAHPERSLIAGRGVAEVRTLLDCEAAPSGWEISGARCTEAPGRDEGRVSGQQGSAWLTTYGPKNGDRAVAELRSPIFTPGPNSLLMFELGGGSVPGLRAVLTDADGRELASFQAQNDQRLRPQFVELAPYAGRALRLALGDAARGGWGHLLLDAVSLVELKPALGVPSGEGPP
jgi:arabinofuranosyltransferase